MHEIKLDPRRLLGFKILASNETTLALHSPKIGGKQCVVVGTPVVAGAANAASAHSKA